MKLKMTLSIPLVYKCVELPSLLGGIREKRSMSEEEADFADSQLYALCGQLIPSFLSSQSLLRGAQKAGENPSCISDDKHTNDAAVLLVIMNSLRCRLKSLRDATHRKCSSSTHGLGKRRVFLVQEK